MSLVEALEVSNLVFLLPMTLGFIFLVVSIIGTETDNDHDFGHDLDGIDDASFGHDASISHEGGFMEKSLSMLGIGKVPFSILMTCWLFIYGFTGMALNGVLGRPVWVISMVIAVVVSVVLTSFLSRALAKIMPKSESYGSKIKDFVSLEATISTLSEDKKKGRGYLIDAHGNTQIVAIESEEPLSMDPKVILLTYNEEENSFTVKNN